MRRHSKPVKQTAYDLENTVSTMFGVVTERIDDHIRYELDRFLAARIGGWYTDQWMICDRWQGGVATTVLGENDSELAARGGNT